MSFRYKIALSVFFLEALVMLGVLWQSLDYLESRLIEQIDLSNKMFIAQLRDYATKEAVLTEDFGDLQIQLENIDLSSGIEEILVLDNRNKVLAASETGYLGQSLDDIATQDNWQIDIVEGASGSLGKLAYRTNNQFSNAATAGALGFGLSLALTGMALVAAVGVLIGTLLSRRLEKIANSLSSLREGVVESYELDESGDEVGQLSRFIFEMGKSLSSRMNELVDLEEHTRFALQSAGAGAWRWDMNENSLFWSAKNFQLMGYLPNKDKPSLRLWRSMIHAEDSQRVDEAVNRMLEEKKNLDVEYRIIRRSGEVRWMRSVGRMYFGADNQPTEVYGLQIDITRYKNTERSLSGQTDLLKKMLNFSKECIITIGSRQEILLNNAATLYLFGYKQGELFGRPITHLFLAEDGKLLESALSADVYSSDQLEGGSIQLTGISKSGNTMPLQVRFEKYKDADQHQRTTLLIRTLLNSRPQSSTSLELEAD